MANPNCTKLQQDVADAQAAANAAQSAYTTLKNKLDAAVKAAYLKNWAISDSEKKQLESLQTQASAAQSALAAAQAALAAAIAAFNETGMKTCPPPKGCTGGDPVSQVIFEINVPPQTQDTTDLEKQKAELEAAIAKLNARKAEIEACLNTPPFDWSKLAINPLSAQDKADFATLNQQLQDTKCLTGNEKAAVSTIINNFRRPGGNWNTGANPWVLLKKSISQLNKIYQDARADREKELRDIDKELADLQAKLNDVNKKIADYANPNSDVNKAKRAEIAAALQARLASCASKIKFTSTTTVTATAGPGVPPGGAGGVSITLQNHGCVTHSNGQFSLNLNTAVLALGPGGCDVENAYWVHPVNVSATINITNLGDIQNCIAAGQPLPGRPPATITNPNPTINLSGCVGAPAKK